MNFIWKVIHFVLECMLINLILTQFLGISVLLSIHFIDIATFVLVRESEEICEYFGSRSGYNQSFREANCPLVYTS